MSNVQVISMGISPFLSILLTVLCTIGLNLPFGYWRAAQNKFSPAWFLAVHCPIPLIIVLRAALEITGHPGLIPLWAGTFFLGQYIGGRLWLRKNGNL